jgi:hypothetical protein
MACTALAICSVSIPSACLAQSDNEVDLPATAIKSANDALLRFSKVKKNWKCFNVRMGVDKRELTVEFYAPNDTISTDKEVILHASACGSGAVFIYDEHGSLKSRYFVK